MPSTRALSLAAAFSLSVLSSAPLMAAGGEAYSPGLAALQDGLAAAGVRHVALEKAELLYHAAGADAASPHVLIANNRTHLLSSQFVENDPRRGGSGDISYLVDQSDGAALSWLGAAGGAIVVLPNAVTEPELDASMAAWAQMNCNGPAAVKVADNGTDPDLIDGLVFGDPARIGTPYADITHAGWLPSSFFNALAPGGASSILGVTFTFVFVDDDGNPTDVDGNGRIDVAFREIYYNRSFPWGTGGNSANVDLQSVAIHEAGHAYGLAHFGKVTVKNGAVHYAPKAIMNAVYVEEDRRILGTDNASFCAIWANSH